MSKPTRVARLKHRLKPRRTSLSRPKNADQWVWVDYECVGNCGMPDPECACV